MSPKEVIFSPNAEKTIKKLQKNDQKLVLMKLDKFASGQISMEIEKLKTQPDFYRIKASHLRIIYYPLCTKRVVILLIRHRKDAYKGLNNLNGKLVTALSQLELKKVNASSRNL